MGDSHAPSGPSRPLPAATLLLVRDGEAGLEVLMVQRHGQSGFAAGALVFPGGKVDAEDEALARSSPPGELLPYRVAAIRETWEEAGILLARGSNGVMVGAADVPAPKEGVAALAGLRLATDTLVHFAHWITPEAEPRRFDTQFFLAATPPDQTAAHDGHETLDCRWLAPAAALAEADARTVRVLFPTRLNLMKLARSKTVAEALERARAERVVSVQPVIETRDDGRRVVRIPQPDTGYAITEMPFGRAAG